MVQMMLQDLLLGHCSKQALPYRIDQAFRLCSCEGIASREIPASKQDFPQALKPLLQLRLQLQQGKFE